MCLLFHSPKKEGKSTSLHIITQCSQKKLLSLTVRINQWFVFKKLLLSIHIWCENLVCHFSPVNPLLLCCSALSHTVHTFTLHFLSQTGCRMLLVVKFWNFGSFQQLLGVFLANWDVLPASSPPPPQEEEEEEGEWQRNIVAAALPKQTTRREGNIGQLKTNQPDNDLTSSELHDIEERFDGNESTGEARRCIVSCPSRPFQIAFFKTRFPANNHRTNNTAAAAAAIAPATDDAVVAVSLHSHATITTTTTTTTTTTPWPCSRIRFILPAATATPTGDRNGSRAWCCSRSSSHDTFPCAPKPPDSLSWFNWLGSAFEAELLLSISAQRQRQ